MWQNLKQLSQAAGFEGIRCALWKQGAVLLFMIATVVVAGAGESNAPAGGQMQGLLNMSLDQLLEVQVEKVYGASRYEQDVARAPSSVSIVTREEIQKQGHRTLAEVLQGLRGMFVTTDRVYSYAGVRGFSRPSDYNSRLLVLVDGHRMNDNIYDSVLLGTEAVLDVDMVERLEMVRGPSSSIYGDNAFFGVINIITRPGAKIDGLEFSGEVGEFQSHGGKAIYGRQFTNGLELVLSGSWYESEGEQRLFYREFNTPASNNGIAENSDLDEAYKFHGKLAYGDFTLTGAWSRREKLIPTASYGTIFNDGGERAVDRYSYLDLKYEHSFANELTLEGRTYYDNYRYLGDYPYNTAPPGDPISRLLNRDITTGEWAGMNWQLTAPVGERITAVAGVDFRGDIRRHQLNYDITPRTTYANLDNSTWNAGVYAQVEWEILTNLVVNTGMRFDYYETFGSTFNPRLALIYAPWQKTNLKLLYGQAFRAPNASETSYGDPDPESIHTYEAVWEQELPARLRFTTSAYYYQVHDLISEMDGVFNNIGRIDAMGMEFELSGRHANGVESRLSYAVQRTEDRSSGDELSNSPRHLVKGSLIAPLYADKLFAGLELQYTGSTISNNRRHIDGYVIANVTLFSQKLARNLEISGSVYNLFDAEYSNAVSTGHLQDSVEQPGRSFRVKLTYKF